MRAVGFKWEEERLKDLWDYRTKTLRSIQGTNQICLAIINRDKYPRVVEVLSKICEIYNNFESTEDLAVLHQVSNRIKGTMINELAQLEEKDLVEVEEGLKVEDRFINPLSAPLLFPLRVKIKKCESGQEIADYAFSIFFDQRVSAKDFFPILELWEDDQSLWHCTQNILEKALEIGRDIFAIIDAIDSPTLAAQAYLHLGIRIKEGRTFLFQKSAGRANFIKDEDQRLNFLKIMVAQLEEADMINGSYILINALNRHDKRVKALILLYLGIRYYELGYRPNNNERHCLSGRAFREAIMVAESIPDFSLKHAVLTEITEALHERGEGALAYRTMRQLCDGSKPIIKSEG